MSSNLNNIDISVWRGTRAGGEFKHYSVPRQPSQTVLDVVTWIQRNAEPGLSYRFACRVGMCGSCAMMVNGVPRWTCRTHIESVLKNGSLQLEPLRNLPIIKDLACDMREFFDRWRQAESEFAPSATRDDPMPFIDPTSAARAAANEAIECINCAVCYAACDVVEWNEDYLGPAALNRAWTLQNDERDAKRPNRLKTIAQSGGCTSCHSQANCSRHCPVELDPSASIAGLKKAVFKAALKGQL